MYIEVKTIKFDDVKEASENKNYPESGLYITELESGTSDLRFVDKSVPHNLFICPKSVFDGLQNRILASTWKRLMIKPLWQRKQ